MKNISDKAIKVLKALIGIVGEHAQGEREGVTISTVGLNSILTGQTRAPFNDYDALRETVEWCEESELPVFAMMLTFDEEGRYPDKNACKLAFKNEMLPAKAELDRAIAAERAEIAAMDEDAAADAEEKLQDAISTLNASKAPTSRRALANARNQEIEVKSWDEWLSKYQHEVLDAMAPGQPLIHNSFLDAQEGYKERAWRRWQEELDFDAWTEESIGSGEIVSKIQPTIDDNSANWITKRFGGFGLKEKLADKKDGIEVFERAAYRFYTGDLVAKDFFDTMVRLLGRQYSVVSHLMFLKDMETYVPVKPDAFEAGLRKLGIEFYLSGYCSWGNYTRFLGYLERIRQMLQEIEPDTTLLDAHSILWIIGSGYWFEGAGAKTVASLRAGRSDGADPLMEPAREDVHSFAEEHRKCMSLENLCEETFAERCRALGFEMDCGNSFIEEYSPEAFNELAEFKRIASEISDAKLLGSAIFSQWRWMTHWSGIPDEKDFEWLVAALDRLAEMTS